MNTAGLSTDQAPPLEVPATFYAIIPAAIVTGGALLLAEGGTLLASSWLPRTIALVHVMTLGVLAAAMLGSLYQMVPVVAGSPVPAIRLSHGVAACLVLGAGALIFGLWSANARAIQLGAVALSIALIAFFVPMAIALSRARGGETLLGMRIAVTCLALLAALGVRLAWGHAGDMPSSRQALLVAHVDLALVGWVGGLITAVSWQVVPMFYLTEAFPKRRAYGIAIGVGVSAAAVTLAALAGAAVTWIVIAALPGAIAVLLVEPWTLARMIPRRKRRRWDPTLQFWWSAIVAAPLVLLAALATWLTDEPRATLVFGWLALWGWGAATVHGMLTRIVPFLAWFHRFAKGQDVPPMKRLLPDEHVRVQLFAHVITTVVGLVAIVSRVDLLARATGACMAITGVLLGNALLGVRRRARSGT